jgi:hypothetical protein
MRTSNAADIRYHNLLERIAAILRAAPASESDVASIWGLSFCVGDMYPLFSSGVIDWL